MSSTDVTSESATATAPPPKPGEMRLEAIPVPVSDVDRAKEFYASLGWREDADFDISEDFRVVQFTPPGSGCSIAFREGHHQSRARLHRAPGGGRLRHRRGA